jgi:DNA polymerase-3 subunit delta
LLPVKRRSLLCLAEGLKRRPFNHIESFVFTKASPMAAVSCTDFLVKKRRGDPPGLIAAHGDSPFLRREARQAVRAWVVGEGPSEFLYSSYEGETAGPGVVDELFTPPFVGDRRLVVVEDADEFVSRYRPILEKLARAPSSVGVLLLDVRTWASNTRLAQAAPLAIQCSTPKEHLIPGWCEKWAEQRYGKKFDLSTSHWLVESAGIDLGVLDQEIAKLASAVGDREEISRNDVTSLVAGRGVENVFAVLDDAMEGRLAKALHELDRVLAAGEPPVKILAIFSAQLRKYGEAFRRATTKIPPDVALREAGIPPFVAAAAERRLRALGSDRAAALYRQILDADLAIKGGSEASPRLILERLLVWLATGTR